MRKLNVLLSIAVLLALACCAAGSDFGRSDPAAGTEAMIQQLSRALPPLSSVRAASTANIAELDGKFTAVRSLNAIDNDLALDLISGTNELSWGVWSFNLQLQELDNLQVVMTVPDSGPDGDQAWIALSDFSHDTWEFHGPLTAGQSLPLTDSRHHAPDGSFHCAVITNWGDQATVYKLVLSSDDGWSIVTVDEAGNVGDYTSLAVINGKPAISYHSQIPDVLKYAESATMTGSQAADWSVSTVDSSGDVGVDNSLAEVVGQPAVSYRDNSNDALKYARRLSESMWMVVTVMTSDVGEHVGYDTSLAVINGKPMITHSDTGTGFLRHSVSISDTGTQASDWQNYVTDNTPVSCQDSSLAFVDGQAAASYFHDGVPGYLSYKWFSTPSVFVAYSDGAAVSTSLAVVDGNPAISWQEDSFGYLYYSYSSTTQGTSDDDWSTVSIDTMGTDRLSTSLAVIDGHPAICYTKQEWADSHLAFAWSSSANGWNADDWRSAVVDASSPQTGYYVSLAEVDGQAAVSYFDDENKCLKYAIRLGP